MYKLGTYFQNLVTMAPNKLLTKRQVGFSKFGPFQTGEKAKEIIIMSWQKTNAWNNNNNHL